MRKLLIESLLSLLCFERIWRRSDVVQCVIMVCISEIFWICLVWAEPANLSEINWIQEFDIWTRLPHSVARSCCVEVMKENCQKLRILWREGSSCSLASATYFATNNIWGYEILNSAKSSTILQIFCNQIQPSFLQLEYEIW